MTLWFEKEEMDERGQVLIDIELDRSLRERHPSVRKRNTGHLIDLIGRNAVRRLCN